MLPQHTSHAVRSIPAPIHFASMAESMSNKRGFAHLDEYEPKPAKHLRTLHDRMTERRLVVVLEGATLETVKV